MRHGDAPVLTQEDILSNCLRAWQKGSATGKRSFVALLSRDGVPVLSSRPFVASLCRSPSSRPFVALSSRPFVAFCRAAGRRTGFRPENGHGTAFWHGSARIGPLGRASGTRDLAFCRERPPKGLPNPAFSCQNAVPWPFSGLFRACGHQPVRLAQPAVAPAPAPRRASPHATSSPSLCHSHIPRPLSQTPEASLPACDIIPVLLSHCPPTAMLPHPRQPAPKPRLCRVGR